jgi:hypothetical protein
MKTEIRNGYIYGIEEGAEWVIGFAYKLVTNETRISTTVGANYILFVELQDQEGNHVDYDLPLSICQGDCENAGEYPMVNGRAEINLSFSEPGDYLIEVKSGNCDILPCMSQLVVIEVV